MNSSQFLKQSSLLMGFKQCNYGKERLFVSGWVLHWRPSTALSLVSLSKTYYCFFFVFAWTYLHLPLLQLFSPFFANPEPRFFLHSFSSSLHFLCSSLWQTWCYSAGMHVPFTFSHCSSPLTPLKPLATFRMKYWTGQALSRHLAASHSLVSPGEVKYKNVTP